MKYTIVSQRPDCATLFVGAPEQAPATEHAHIVWQSLKESEHFAHAAIVSSGSLNPVAVWRVADFGVESLQKEAKEIAQWAQKNTQIAVEMGALDEKQATAVLETLVAAIGHATYRFNRFKKDPQNVDLQEVLFIHTSASPTLQAALQHAESLLYGVNLCKDLGNTAPNVCTPTYLAQTAAKEAQDLGASARIFGGDYIRENMPSFWSVAKGSVQEPQLLELTYTGAADKNAPPVVLVGKGLTFDSGGISLKPGEGMDEMKYDMCGAASVIGAFIAAVKAKLPVNLVAVVATCENMPDGGAAKPGDVVKAMDGTSIENLNTDAEGRLVLCDALTFVAQNHQPKAVIDVATLTGACVIALGHVASGLLSNNQELAEKLLQASRTCNDKIWQLPLFPEYKEQLKSNFADMQNIGGRPAGTITAATFLAHFAQNYHWAHLDIAGTAWQSGSNKGATGRPVPLLVQYLRDFAA